MKLAIAFFYWDDKRGTWNQICYMHSVLFSVRGTRIRTEVDAEGEYFSGSDVHGTLCTECELVKKSRNVKC
jgi:hypothetical protein